MTGAKRCGNKHVESKLPHNVEWKKEGKYLQCGRRGFALESQYLNILPQMGRRWLDVKLCPIRSCSESRKHLRCNQVWCEKFRGFGAYEMRETDRAYIRICNDPRWKLQQAPKKNWECAIANLSLLIIDVCTAPASPNASYKSKCKPIDQRTDVKLFCRKNIKEIYFCTKMCKRGDDDDKNSLACSGLNLPT